ncbi:MAG: PKD domain-containing protein [Solirubrobacteraceae bacterium]
MTALAAAPAQAQVATPASPIVVDGPSPDIVGLSGLSVARDGTGGLVYLKNVGGTQHVFVSRLLGGVFRTPEQIDSTLAGPSSQPVIAAGNGGVLLLGFINGGALYVVQALGSSQGFSAPAGVIGGASNLSLQLSNLGKAYLAFTVADGDGSDVRAAFWARGGWALESSPLNAIPADDAGTGSGRPQVATGGDGVGTVVWGEGGHIYSRRVWGVGPSVVIQQADAPLPGCSEASADDPQAGVGGDSSYVGVAFQEVLSCGGQRQQRVLFNRLHGSAYDGITPVDGLSTSGADGAEQPQVVMSEYGAGWVVSNRDGSNPLDANQIFAMSLANNVVTKGISRIDSLANAAPPDAVAGTAGLFSNVVAWQQSPGSAGVPEIRVRFTPAKSSMGPETVVSSPQNGPTDAADGLDASGDVNGDAAVAWVQGVAGTRQIVTAQLYQPPGGLHALKQSFYARTPHPLLSWSAVRDPWRLVYQVFVDGAQIAQTTVMSLRIPAVTPDGPHRWEVIAVNPAGLESQSKVATVFVDRIAPLVKTAVLGTRQVLKRLHVFVSYGDPPPPLSPAADASGVAKVTVNWGDRTKLVTLKLGNRRSFHTYLKPGRYRVTVTVTDRAGNTTRTITTVKVKPKPKPHKKPKKGATK